MQIINIIVIKNLQMIFYEVDEQLVDGLVFCQVKYQASEETSWSEDEITLLTLLWTHKQHKK